MKLVDVYKQCDFLAPKTLSDEYCTRYGAYDNSGILIDTGENINGVVFSLDFSLQAIKQAEQTGANLIITHHPAIYGKISDLRVSDFDPIDRKLVRCVKKGISVISMHLNLDCAKDGIDESLAKALGETGEETLMHPLSTGGYGRAYEVEQTCLGDFAEKVKTNLQAKKVLIYGENDKKIARVASFCGGGADEQSVQFAKEQGADAIVSSDFKHHIITLAKESELAVIALTHYASECYGFEKFYQKIRRSISVPCEFCTDETLL